MTTVYRKEEKTMEYITDEAAKHMHEAYLKCKTVFDPKYLMVNNRVDFKVRKRNFSTKSWVIFSYKENKWRL